MLPCSNCVQCGLPPVERFMVLRVRRTVDEDTELFVLWLDEPLPHAIPDNFAERVVIGQNIEQYYGCKV